MFDIFQNTSRPNNDLFFRKNDADDPRLGEISALNNYEDSAVVILGCPQDEGVRRNGGRVGAALAPEAIRRQFYKLTTFGITVQIFDLGDTVIKDSLEETHELHTKIVESVLRDGKKLIVLGGGNDVSYADGCAMANVFGSKNWLGFNIDAHFDVRADQPRNSGTPYRQLLDGKLIAPEKFYEMGYQPQSNSQVYYDYLRRTGVRALSLHELGSVGLLPTFQRVLENTEHSAVFWGFDVDAVNAADAPGVSAPSPLGLSGFDFCELAKSAGIHANTKIVEFTEVNPLFDVDNRTAKLVAAAMHEFIRVLR